MLKMFQDSHFKTKFQSFSTSTKGLVTVRPSLVTNESGGSNLGKLSFFFHGILKDIKSLMAPDYALEEFKEMAVSRDGFNVDISSFLRGKLETGLRQ